MIAGETTSPETTHAWRFGTSGFLLNSNKLMYDRRTRTLWQSITGEPVIGPLAYSGVRLRLLPMTVTTWAEWVEEHPETSVLSLDTGFRYARYLKPGTPGSQYFDYYTSPDLMFPAFRSSPALAEKSDVFGLEVNGAAKAYPMPVLAKELVVNDELGGREVVIVAHQAGGAVRAYDRAGRLFAPGPGPGTVVDESGAVWTARDEGLVMDGRPRERLERIPGYTLFWFGWYAFRPHADIYRGR